MTFSCLSLGGHASPAISSRIAHTRACCRFFCVPEVRDCESSGLLRMNQRHPQRPNQISLTGAFLCRSFHCRRWCVP